MAKYVQPIFNVHGIAEFLNKVTFDTSVYLTGKTHISSPVTAGVGTPYALTVDTVGANVEIKSKQLGTMAFETSTNYYGKTQVDVLKAQIDASIIRIDASLNDTIDALTLFPTIAYVDGSLNARVKKAGDTMTGALLISAGGLSVTGDVSISAGLNIDSVRISGIDTSAEGFGIGSDNRIPTSALVKSAIDSAIAAGVTADNGLHEQPNGNIQLGGVLTHDTSIDFNVYDFHFVGIGTGTGLNAIIQQGTTLRTQQLGTMALEVSSNYYGKTAIDGKFTNVDTSLNNIWVKFGSVDTSLTNLGIQNAQQDASIIALRSKDGNIDTSLNSIWTKFGSVDTSLTNLGIKNANQDASISILNNWNVSQDASIAALQNATVKAWNGLTATDQSVGLGGSLIMPTTITAGATNTLAIAGLQTSSLDTPYAVVEDSIGGALKYRQLGSMAWETSTNYYGKTYIDSSLTQVWTKFGYVDTSLNSIWTKFGYVDTSLNTIWTKFGYVDTSLNNIWTKLGYVDTSMATMNLWNVNQDSSIAAISSAQGNYVKKSGDTMTGNLTISTGGLVITAGDVSIMGGDAYFSQHVHVGGNLQVDGSLIYTNVSSINVSTGFIQLNTGLTGAPPPTLQSGIIVNRGTSAPYIFVYDEDVQSFRIGISQLETSTHYSDASTQAVATREDAPLAFGVPFWNASKYRFDTSVGFLFTPGVGLSLPIATTQANNTNVLSISGGLVGKTILGTMAFEASTNYASLGNVDGSLSVIWTKIVYIDSSLAGLGNAVQDLSVNKLGAVASTTGVTGTSYQIYSGEADNVAYIKRLKAGAGTTITEDSSAITIAVGGTTGVQKYRGTFDGTGTSPFGILATTHGLGTGPFVISVYESGSQVYTGIDVNGSGDVNLTWSAGALTDASCKFIITG